MTQIDWQLLGEQFQSFRLNNHKIISKTKMIQQENVYMLSNGKASIYIFYCVLFFTYLLFQVSFFLSCISIEALMQYVHIYQVCLNYLSSVESWKWSSTPAKIDACGTLSIVPLKNNLNMIPYSIDVTVLGLPINTIAVQRFSRKEKDKDDSHFVVI